MNQPTTISRHSSSTYVSKSLKQQHYDVAERHVMMYLLFLTLASGQYDQKAHDYFTFFNPQPLANHDHVSLHRVKVTFHGLVKRGDIVVNHREHAKNQVFIKNFKIVKN